MKELISEEDLNESVDFDLSEYCFEWGYLMNLRRIANKRHEEAMERYKALVDLTNEPDVEAWESRMKQRAIEFAEFWSAECNHPESYYLTAEEAYNKKYESTRQA